MEEMLNLPVFRKGKVRDVYNLGDKLLLIASDRVSAFDYVLPDVIPAKGKVLTAISNFWFENTKHIIDNHVLSTDIKEISSYLPAGVHLPEEYYQGRTVLGKRAERVDFECVVRGYISGSAWKEYQQKGSVGGIRLPAGLKEAEELPEPIFTPAVKADTGHDENVPFYKMEEAMHKEEAEYLRDVSIRLYNYASARLKKAGIILADTKFEFGKIDGKMIIIDEMLTPDSSRFWDLEHYSAGSSPVSFDKQFVRDYLESTKWDKNSPPPHMPADIIEGAAKKYKEALEKILKS
ncbi:phosphoribosylaminoimidazole-succinocarboxamide synthase [Parelusimicrobium proximum]|uniref:phosphoribosylaminoimidazolesuccinocarboxamide synthase n=1 Tax=Parelusimicrobium proximum TaxID=3228953 RepID=UPI003D174F3F